MDTVAAVDIGTNTCRMLIAARRRGGGFIPLLKERAIVRLGKGYRTSSKMSDQSVTKGIKTLKEFSRKMRDCKVEKCSAVATGVVRRALNATEFLKKVKEECNLPVKVISGEDEALLTLRGVELVFPAMKRKGSWLIFDIGGGSTELIYCENGEVKIIESIDLGVVTLADLIESDPPLKKELRVIEREIDRIFMPVAEKIKEQLNNKRPFLIGTAGTVTTLAAMDQALLEYQPEKINGFLLGKYAVQGMFNHLIKLQEREREGIPGLEKGRGKVIIPGCVILLIIMDAFEAEGVSVSDSGLLEGIIRDLFDSLDTPDKLV